MKLEQLNPATVTEGQIKQTDEYKALVKSNDADRLMAACRYFVRRDVTADEFVSLFTGGPVQVRQRAVEAAMNYALARVGEQRQVTGTARRELINKTTTMKWQPSGSVKSPKTNNNFIKLIHGTGNVPLRTGQCTMNCWEAIITAAMLDGRLPNPQKLKETYRGSDEEFTMTLVNAFASGRKHVYQPGTLAGTPMMGDIVFFDDLAHIALATGDTSSGVAKPPFYPGADIISFWPAPKQVHFGPGTLATVEVTTIESIVQYAANTGMGVFSVTFGSPHWSALNG